MVFLVVIVVAWSASVVAIAATALERGGAGREALREARRAAGLRELLDGTVSERVAEAADAFDDANRRTHSPLLAPLRLTPVLGRHLASGKALTQSARDVAHEIADAAMEGETLLERGEQGPEGRLEVVEAMLELVGRITSVAESADLGPADALVGPFSDARSDFETELDDLIFYARRAQLGLAALADLLRGPSTTLVFAANNAEMRAGAGMLLSVGAMQTQGGRSDVGDLVPVEEINEAATPVELPSELASLWGWAEPDREIRNLLLSPRFPVAAEVGAGIWESAGQGSVDGVIAIDPIAIGEIVEVSGPLTVGDERFNGGTLVDELLHEQYVRFARDERSERKERSAEVAAAVMRAVVDGDWDLIDMVEALERAVAGRHLLAWSRDPATQAGWEALGVEGDLSSDSVMVALNSRASGKIDPFMRLDATMAASRSDSGIDVSIDLCIRNTTPIDEPPTVTSDRPAIGLSAGDYRGILAVSVPLAASNVRFEDVSTLHVSGLDGPSQVIGYQILLRRGEAHSAALRFTLPAGLDHLVVEPSARVPGVRWRDARGSWTDDRARSRRLREGSVAQPPCDRSSPVP